MIKVLQALTCIVALLTTGCAQSGGATTAANAYLPIRANLAGAWEAMIYYRRESDETPSPLSPQDLRRNHQAEIVVDRSGDITALVEAVSRTKRVQEETLQLNARWGIVFKNSDGKDMQSFYVDPRGWIKTGSSEYETDGALLAFLHDKLSCVMDLAGK